MKKIASTQNKLLALLLILCIAFNGYCLYQLSLYENAMLGNVALYQGPADTWNNPFMDKQPYDEFVAKDDAEPPEEVIQQKITSLYKTIIFFDFVFIVSLPFVKRTLDKRMKNL